MSLVFTVILIIRIIRMHPVVLHTYQNHYIAFLNKKYIDLFLFTLVEVTGRQINHLIYFNVRQFFILLRTCSLIHEFKKDFCH